MAEVVRSLDHGPQDFVRAMFGFKPSLLLSLGSEIRSLDDGEWPVTRSTDTSPGGA